MRCLNVQTNQSPRHKMLVSAKRIPLYPTRSATLKPGEIFDIPSGMGGSFSVRFTGFEKHLAVFVICHASDPPEGWNGERRAYPIATLHENIYGYAPDSPYMDDGKHELITLGYLGYPPNSPEIAELLRRFPKVADRLVTLDRYFALHARLTKTTRFEIHRYAERGGVKPRYSAPQAAIVAEMEEIEASFVTRYRNLFPIYHKVWLAVRQPKGWKPLPYKDA